MVRRVGRTVIAAAAIGAAVLVGNAAVSVLHTAVLRNESAAVLHSNELLLALDNVLSLVKDAESGQRGYVITGDPAYLAPYRAAVASIQAQMNALERLAREDPVQQRLMADVRRRVGAKLGELELTIGLRDRKGFDLARDVMLLGAGRAEMEALRATAAEMAAHEAQRLAARQAAADATYRAALFSEVLGALRGDQRFGLVAGAQMTREHDRKTDQRRERRQRAQRLAEQRRPVGRVGGGLARDQTLPLVRGHLGRGRAQRLHLGAAGAERDDVAGEVESLAVAHTDRHLELAELGADAAPHVGHQS